MSDADEPIADDEVEKPVYEIDGDGRTVVPLLYPITIGSREIVELRLRRIKGKDIEASASVPEAKQTTKLISLLSGEPPVVIGELDFADTIRLSEVVEGFQKAGRQTGATRSS